MIYRLKRGTKAEICGNRNDDDCYACLHVLSGEDFYLVDDGEDRKEGKGYDFEKRTDGEPDKCICCSAIQRNQLILVNDEKERTRYLLNRL